MIIARIIISILYAVLMLFATFAQYKKDKKFDILMCIGAILLIVANLPLQHISIVMAVCALLIIHVAALLNGKANGKINITHHLVRLIISIAICLLFLFS